MAKSNSVRSAFASDRPMVDCERYRISFSKRNDFCSRLHARTLLDQNKFATLKITFRLR